MKLFLLRLFLLLLAVCCLCLPSVVCADVQVAVIYPEVDQPYAKVFEQIIDEIKQEKGLDVNTYVLREAYDTGAVKRWIIQQKAQTLVALGQRGVDVVEHLDIDIPSDNSNFHGNRDQAQNKLVSGISLTPDPDLLFQHLKQMAPGIKRIHVVYNPDRYQWLIDYANKAATKRGLKIVANAAICPAPPLYTENCWQIVATSAMPFGCCKTLPQWAIHRFYPWCLKKHGIKN